MKRIILSLVSLFVFSFANAQTTVFHENFEVVDSMTSSGNPTWLQHGALQHSGAFSMRDTIAVGDSAYLTSIAFSTLANFNVLLDFWHICKISFADAGTIEVSNDNGSTWTQLTAAQYLNSPPSGFTAQNLFSSAVYGPTGTGWQPANNNAIPTNTWWKHEFFDVSTLLANAAQARIRFKIKDANGNGNQGNYGWLIDDVKVVESPNELFPPHIAWSPPVLQGNIYNLGPYTISDTITDPSGLASGVNAPALFYTINSGSLVQVAMTNVSGNIWQGGIPAVNNGDTVCYYVIAKDIWLNAATLPTSGCLSFIASQGIVFPYVDNFDITTNLWTATSTGGGSNWELGTPSFGVTNTAHSAPNSWDIDLVSGYVNNANCTLTSPVFSFIGTSNPTLSFWQNRRCEAFWDGTRLEYTLDGTNWSLLGVVGDPAATNWYTNAQLNSSGLPGWDGNSNGWTKSSYKLGCLLSGASGPVQFRFIFTSDGSVIQDGFSIDDFSITLPPPQDVGVASIIQPGAVAPAATTGTVIVVVANFGNQSVSGFNVSYSVNGGAPVTQAYPGTLLPCATDTVVFTTTFSVPAGTFGICSYTSFASDGDHNNDTICKNSQGIPLIALPYTDDFETPPALWYDSSTFGTIWELGTPAFGATSSAHSGTQAWDINLTTTYGDNAYSTLTSPLFDFTAQVNAKLSFWMNRNIDINGDGVYLEYSVDGGTTFQRLGVVGDPNALGNWYNITSLNFTGLPAWDGNSGGWVKYTYILGPPFNNAGPNVQFKFIFASNFFTTTDGVSIDDFAIIPASPVDLGVISIIQPANSSGSGLSTTVEVTIRNFGTTTITNTDVAYVINGALIATEPWTGSIVPSASANFTFATQFIVPSGLYDICSYTSLVADGDHLNDTLCTSKHGIPLFTLPFFDSFDTGPVVWIDSSGNPTTHWELGTPAFGQTNNALSPPNSWDINLASGYGDNASSYLTSPLFDFTGIFNAKLTFWQNRRCEAGWDGTRVEYSLNGGGTWQVLGVQFDPLGTYWYNKASIFSSALPAWDGTSIDSVTGAAGWIRSTYKLVPLNNAGANCMLRFVFTSDGIITQDGFSIDDLKIVPPSPQDASAISILQPGAYSPAAVLDSVKVIISNEGLNPISNFDVSYTINSVLTGTATYTGTLQPSIHDTITLPPFTVPTGLYDICAYTSLAGDGDFTNDTTCKSSHGVPLIALPYVDNFDTGAVIWSDSSGAGTNWQLGAPNFGATNSTHSGAQAWDINLNSAYGDNAFAVLTSPLFDFTAQVNAKLSFWMNRNIDTNGDGMYLEYSVNGSTSWQRLGVVADPNALGNWYNIASLNFSGLPAWDGSSGGWVKYTYILGPPFNNAGPVVQFRFVFTSNFFTVGDGVSIDDFSIVPASPIDLGVISINQPATSAGSGLATTVDVTIRNFGTTTITNTDVAYVVNGALIATEPWTGSLVPSATVNFSFATQFTVPSGIYDICSYTSLVADGDHLNDTVCNSKHGIPLFNIPYFDNFDSGPVVWVDSSGNPGSQWQWGTPNFGQTTGAFSAPNCWDINLNSAYGNNARSYLTSPLFDFGGISNAELIFWHNRRCEMNWDGTRVDYSTNGGGSWQVLGTVGDPLATNWYTNPQLISSGLPGWDGTSLDSVTALPGWSRSSYTLTPLNNAGPNVMFRFVFTSDGSVIQDGYSIDNFEIFVPVTLSAAPVALSGINNPFAISGPQTISAYIKNRGGYQLNSVDATLVIDGVTLVTDTGIQFTPPLQNQDSALHVFSVTWTPSSGGHNICVITSLPNGSTDLDPADDTTCVVAGVFDSVLVTTSAPYCNDFETGNGHPSWIPLNAYNYALFDSDWQLGTPDKPVINTAYSGVNAWVTNITGNYSPKDSSGLFSPVFAVDSVGCYELSFWHNYNTELYQDGGTVEYSYDSGVSWRILGYVWEPNWFNSMYITGLVGGPPTAGWSGNSNGWIRSVHNVKFAFSTQVIFRFRFGADPTTEMDGWAIDDVCFQRVSACVIGVEEIDGNSATLEQPFPNPASDLTYFTYSIPEHGKVKLYVTDVLGRVINLLTQESQDAGRHQASLNVKNLADGMYYCTLEFGNLKLVRKFVVAK